MSDVTIPSYRVPRERRFAGPSWRMLAVAGGLLGVVALAGAIAWGLSGGSGSGGGLLRSGGVPVLEPDSRPVKVRPESPGGLVVPNTDQLVLEPPAVRRAVEREQGANARLAPAPEAPQLDLLRRQAAPPDPPAAAPVAPAARLQGTGPGAAPPAVANAPPASPAAGPAAPPAATPPRPATGRVVVQLGALGSEEAARAEWARLQRRVPDLAGRQPQITRLDRGETQPPLWRLRTGGLPDGDAARALCEAVRAQSGACALIGGG